MAWGIVGAYLLLAVEATSLARKRLPRKVWRWTHGLAFPLFAFSTIHGLTAGTDATETWLQVLMVVTSIAVAVLTVVRIVNLSSGGTRQRRPALRSPISPSVPPA